MDEVRSLIPADELQEAEEEDNREAEELKKLRQQNIKDIIKSHVQSTRHRASSVGDVSRKMDDYGDDLDKADELDEEMIKDAFEFKFKDRSGRMILHRAALEQKHETLEKVLSKVQETFRANLIEQKDIFGNTPLLIACIKDTEEGDNTRARSVKVFLDNKANANVFNPRTLWGPLHWCARYGDQETIDMLLLNRAIPYMPDSKGLYALDLAGLYGHQDVVQIFIQSLLRLIKEYREVLLDENGEIRPREELKEAERRELASVLEAKLLAEELEVLLEE